jgi:hypothetical protein
MDDPDTLWTHETKWVLTRIALPIALSLVLAIPMSAILSAVLIGLGVAPSPWDGMRDGGLYAILMLGSILVSGLSDPLRLGIIWWLLSATIFNFVLLAALWWWVLSRRH